MVTVGLVKDHDWICSFDCLFASSFQGFRLILAKSSAKNLFETLSLSLSLSFKCLKWRWDYIYSFCLMSPNYLVFKKKNKMKAKTDILFLILNKLWCLWLPAVTSILLYGCTTWTLTKRLEKKLDGNYTRMLRAILNKSWQQHPTRHQLYGHLPPITKTIQVRRTGHAGHCWRSRDEMIRDVLLWIPTHGRAKAGRPARTYIQQLCEDTGCCPEDLPRAMNDREEWRERVRDIRATSAIWWWWLPWYWFNSFMLI